MGYRTNSGLHPLAEVGGVKGQWTASFYSGEDYVSASVRSVHGRWAGSRTAPLRGLHARPPGEGFTHIRDPH